MCVIYLAIDQHPDHPLILLANRDEYYDRPSLAASWWQDHPYIRAGRDLVGGGTWLGVTSSGCFAAVTNYRDPLGPIGELSRGKLVSEFLTSELSAEEYLNGVADQAARYSGFNLIVGEIRNGTVDAAWFSNRGDGIKKLPPGVYGLSNHLLDTPWPKVRKGKVELSRVLEENADREAMFDLLYDRTLADDEELPDTGIGFEKEKLLSSIFIETPIYGTRCSTVIIADGNGKFDFEERVFV